MKLKLGILGFVFAAASTMAVAKDGKDGKGAKETKDVKETEAAKDSPKDAKETPAAKDAKGPKSIVTCIDDRPWVPYTNPDPKNPGTMQTLIKKVGDEMGVQVEVKALPWKRCQEEVRKGTIDAMVGAAFADFNREFAEFPQAGTEADGKRSLESARVMLVRKSGSKAEWDGSAFKDLSLPVGVAMGTVAMANAVTKAGGKVDGGGKTDEQNLKKLLRDDSKNGIGMMAGYENDLKILLDSADFKGKVEMLPKPLTEAPYFLAFGKDFVKKNKDFVDGFWNKIGAARK